ncbi:MAG: hypothetical protein WCT07_02800 [Candidatus Paceibacterota bacterium]|jgi:hypothetical protein
MLVENYIYIVFILSFIGTLFALYMALHRLITKVCAFNEECPYFLGYPACYFGLSMFIVMLMISSMSIWLGLEIITTKQILMGVSALGIIFAGSYIEEDIRLWLVTGRKYALVLPSCTYGLIFYAVIFIVSLLK